jgi:hypothetical protein
MFGKRSSSSVEEEFHPVKRVRHVDQTQGEYSFSDLCALIRQAVAQRHREHKVEFEAILGEVLKGKHLAALFVRY